MRLALALAAVAALALGGCATNDKMAVLSNLQGCERHYNGAVSAGVMNAGFTGTVQIDCPAHKPPPLPAGQEVGAPPL